MGPKFTPLTLFARPKFNLVAPKFCHVSFPALFLVPSEKARKSVDCSHTDLALQFGKRNDLSTRGSNPGAEECAYDSSSFRSLYVDMLVSMPSY